MIGFDLEIRVHRRSAGGERFVLDVNFRTESGITVAFGASGSGKSTLLLAIVGVLRPSTGKITVAGRTLFDSAIGEDLPIRARRVGVVLQDALLFPHLDVLENVAFGVRGPVRNRHARVMLDRVGAGGLAKRMPRELSGGERQRVALARALAAQPAALLLDEPFSALDAPSREDLATVLLSLHEEIGIPFLHVTHDIGEALRLGSEMVVLEQGRIVQRGSPAEVVSSPSSVATARAVGTENLFVGTVLKHDLERGYSEVDLGGTVVETGLLDTVPGQRVAVGLRAEEVLLSRERVRGTSARNVIAGVVQSVKRRGPVVEVRAHTPVVFRAAVTPGAADELELEPGCRIHLVVKARSFQALY